MAENIYLDKARVALAGAESEFTQTRYVNVANRAYYACFHAAIAALLAAGIRPEGNRAAWQHSFVQSRFVGQLINRRKLYSVELRDTLPRNQAVRHTADYREQWVTNAQAARALQRARMFVAAIEQGIPT